MDTILGLLGMAVWIAGTIGIAASVTYAVIRIWGRFFPDDELTPKAQEPSAG